MSTASTLPPLPALKPFSLTHILYDPLHPSFISLPLTLLSLSPIFLFVSYFTLIIFDRRLTVLNLALGSIANELLSWGLKRVWKGDRPYVGLGAVGDGYGMPSSHSQAAGFLVAWGVGYTLTMEKRREVGEAVLGVEKREGNQGKGREVVRKVRVEVYVFGLVLWSVLTAYSRYYLLYHTPVQIVAGYIVGLAFGAVEFCLTEHIPLYYPSSPLGQLRRFESWVWEGIGGVGGWSLGGTRGGWGEGGFIVNVDQPVEGASRKSKRS